MCCSGNTNYPEKTEKPGFLKSVKKRTLKDIPYVILAKLQFPNDKPNSYNQKKIR